MTWHHGVDGDARVCVCVPNVCLPSCVTMVMLLLLPSASFVFVIFVVFHLLAALAAAPIVAHLIPAFYHTPSSPCLSLECCTALDRHFARRTCLLVFSQTSAPCVFPVTETHTEHQLLHHQQSSNEFDDRPRLAPIVGYHEANYGKPDTDVTSASSTPSMVVADVWVSTLTKYHKKQHQSCFGTT